MKTFTDLKFEAYSKMSMPNFIGHKQAKLAFENGYEVSVLFGNMFYSNGIDTYEVAILLDGNLCYNTGITDDVIGYITADEVTDIMKKVQAL